MKRSDLWIIVGLLAGAAALLFVQSAHSEEVQLPAIPRYIPDGLEIKTVTSLEELPYEFARNLPDELYYWWARAWNNAQYNQSPEVVRTTSVEDQDYSSRTTGAYSGGYWGGPFASNTNSSTRLTGRVFETTAGMMPAIIYNPYAREKTHGSEAAEEGGRPRIQAKIIGTKE